MDDSIRFVPNIEHSSGRAITPIGSTSNPIRGHLTLPRRYGSAPRSGSASKGVSLSTAITDLSRSSRINNLSWRKQRKWENDNLVGIQNLLLSSFGETGITEDVSATIQICWKSNFSSLLSKGNEDLLKEYLSCRVAPIKVPFERTICEPKRCWGKIDSKLKAIVLRCIEKAFLKSFLGSLEDIISTFTKFNGTEEYDILLASYHVPPIEPSDDGLVFSFETFPLYRVLLHAACQYYGIRSRVSDIVSRDPPIFSNLKPFFRPGRASYTTASARR